MSEHFSDRTIMMVGESGYSRLCSARVAVFGVGGVGGYAVEALARAGVGAIDLIDSDTVSVSNINRQIIATENTVGALKTEAARERILSINPKCKVICHSFFYSKETAEKIDLMLYDYIIDAMDSVSSKVELISAAHKLGVKIISAMGAGNKLDPTRFRVADISKTAVCPLAKAVRVALRKRGINHLKVVYSEEPPVINCKSEIKKPTDNITATHTPSANTDEQSSTPSAKVTLACCAKTNSAKTEIPQSTPEQYYKTERKAPGSISFVPSVMGLILAGEVIKELSGIS